MTCIVALEHRGKVYFGADSCVCAEDGSRCRDEDKLVRGAGWVMGFAGNGLATDALCRGRLPPYRGEPARKWLSGCLVPRLRILLKGVGIRARGKDTGVTALVGLRRAGLWCFDDTLSVVQFRQPWGAVGCGEPYARGALSAMAGLELRLEPRERLARALQAAADYSGWVAEPWTWAQV